MQNTTSNQSFENTNQVSSGLNNSTSRSTEHHSEEARLAAAGLEQNPLGRGVGTQSSAGHVHTTVYQSNEQPVANPAPVNIQHIEGSSGISLPTQHHHTEHHHEHHVATPAPPPQQPAHVHREHGLPADTSDNILDTSERARDTDADDYRSHRGEGKTEFTNNTNEAGGLRPHGTKPTQQTGKDTYENQAGSAHASTHKPVDPRDIDVSIGAKGEYAQTTSSSNMGPTSIGGGEGTGVNKQTDGFTTGGQGKRDGEALGGGGGIIGKIAEKMGMGKGNTHTVDDGERATAHAAGKEYTSKVHAK